MRKYLPIAAFFALLVAMAASAVFFGMQSASNGSSQSSSLSSSSSAGSSLSSSSTEWKTYDNKNQHLHFQYPASFSIVTDKEWLRINDSTVWYRILLEDSASPSKPSFILEVNPDGYGPFFPDESWTLSEQENGSIQKTGEKLLPKSEYSDGNQTLIIPSIIHSQNGNTYSMRFSYLNKGEDLRPVLRQILASMRFSPKAPLPDVKTWTTYGNHGDAFEFSHPADMEVTRVTQVQVDNKHPLFTQGSKLAFPKRYTEGTNLSDASVNVAVVPCSGTHGDGTTKTINGIPFQTWSGADAGMGHVGEVTTYETSRNGKCYYMALSLYYANPQMYEGLPDKPAIFDREALEGIFTQILPTFQFTSSASSQPSATEWRTYGNGNDHFTVSLPKDWEIHLQNQPEMLTPTFSGITGTKFKDPSTDAFVFVAFPKTCPNLSIDGSNQPRLIDTTIDGKRFSTASYMDGAAGSVGEFHYYVSKVSASHCIFVVSFYFHTTGEAYDEPMRSQVKADIAQKQAVIERVVRSLKFE